MILILPHDFPYFPHLGLLELRLTAAHHEVSEGRPVQAPDLGVVVRRDGGAAGTGVEQRHLAEGETGAALEDLPGMENMEVEGPEWKTEVLKNSSVMKINASQSSCNYGLSLCKTERNDNMINNSDWSWE